MFSTRQFASVVSSNLKQVFNGWFLAGFLIAFTTPAFSDVLEDAQKQRVMISAGDITLGATLFKPKGSSKDIPAIVTAHGSAPTTRDEVGFYTYRALQMGFAVLSFDKRGTGVSTGTYKKFSVENSEEMFDALAMDVVHAVRWLADQRGIDTSRIGLFGGSQAGWIMPLAASREPLVKFIIVGEGATVSAGEEAVHGRIGGDGEGWDRVKIEKADAALRDFRGDHGFDPAPVLRDLEIPTFWLFGLRDDVIPVYPSLERLEELIKDGKTNNSIHVFAFGDHNYTNTATGGRYDVRKVAEDWLVEIEILSRNRAMMVEIGDGLQEK